MNKHTPGPWQWMETQINYRIGQRLNKKREELTAEDGVMVFCLKGPLHSVLADEKYADQWDYPTVMELAWHSVNGDTIHAANPSHANACLIAAAPDLLEACEGLLSVLPATGHHAIDVARAAIAKAKGEGG